MSKKYHNFVSNKAKIKMNNFLKLAKKAKVDEKSEKQKICLNK